MSAYSRFPAHCVEIIVMSDAAGKRAFVYDPIRFHHKIPTSRVLPAYQSTSGQARNCILTFCTTRPFSRAAYSPVGTKIPCIYQRIAKWPTGGELSSRGTQRAELTLAEKVRARGETATRAISIIVVRLLYLLLVHCDDENGAPKRRELVGARSICRRLGFPLLVVLFRCSAK